MRGGDSFDQESQPPQCASCSGRVWVASRPERAITGRHPQERRGWFDRAVAAFAIGMLFAGALSAIALFGSPVLPLWAIWALCAAAASSMLAAIVVSDGIAVESKACQVVCGGCGAGFTAPWRPNR